MGFFSNISGWKRKVMVKKKEIGPSASTFLQVVRKRGKGEGGRNPSFYVSSEEEKRGGEGEKMKSKRKKKRKEG